MILSEMFDEIPDDYRAYKRLAFLEADKQQKLDNADRNYETMKMYYESAAQMYEASGNNGDTEMEMLATMMRDLHDGGWF